MSAPFFDTNIIIDVMLDRTAAIEELGRHDSHRISRVVWTELLAGEPSTTRGRLGLKLTRFEIVEIDETIATMAADIRHVTRMKLLDAFILATARVNGAMLVTRNTKDFPPGMPGVRIPYTL